MKNIEKKIEILFYSCKIEEPTSIAHTLLSPKAKRFWVT